MDAQDSSYDQNALRVESRLGDLQIVRGIQGTVVAQAGLFRGPNVTSLVGQSEKALAEAKVFERNYEPGQAFAALGIATLGAAIGASRIQDINAAIPSGLTAASFLLIAYGGSKLESAYRALSRSIWFYNRELKR
jgi:F420-dependent methylenetetrahydromethanopterin dehydrogenase